MSNTSSSKKWNEESTAQLVDFVGEVTADAVPAEQVTAAAEMLDVSTRSIAAKLRKLGYIVASMAAVKTSGFSEEDTSSLRSFVEDNAGELTYKEIAEAFQDGKFTAKQIQGKVLAMELTGSVKPSEKVKVASDYSETDEDTFVTMADEGKYIEDIAEALGKSIASIRGKALSLLTKGLIEAIPAQKTSHAKASVDIVDTFGADIATMTVAEIAAASDKTERGIKTTLTRRGIKVADYDGAAKQAKARSKAEDAETC